MREKKLINLIKGTSCRIFGDKNIKVKNVTTSSKDVRRGDLFVAVKGGKYDGHNFISEAINNGAAVIVYEKGRKRFIPKHIGSTYVETDDTRDIAAKIATNFFESTKGLSKIVGITGTDGKTTTSYLVESIFKVASLKPAVMGTINYRFQNLQIASSMTTPDPVYLHKNIAEFKRHGAKSIILEVSSHSLHQKRVVGLKFTQAVFTNLSSEHLDYHKTIANYFKAKKILFDMLSERASAIINYNDVYGRKLIKMQKQRVLSYGLDRHADIFASMVRATLNYTKFKVFTPKGSFDAKTSLVGEHNIFNILAATGVGIASGLSHDVIKKGIENLKLVPGRLERIKAKKGINVFVDYAHTPGALEHVLSCLNSLKTGRLILVFGCGGNRDRKKRPNMGKIASAMSDFFIITSDNPRFENPNAIISEIKKGINMKSAHYAIEPDRFRAIEKAVKILRENDTLLIAGKGHEDSQQIKDKKIKFSDFKNTKVILKKHGLL